MTASALHNKGIQEVHDMIQEYLHLTCENRYFEARRNEQNKFWLFNTIEEQLKSNFYHHPEIKKELQSELEKIENGETTPFNAAKRLLNL